MSEITKETKLKQLLEEYPWLVDKAIELDPRGRLLKSPVGKLFLRNATVGDLGARIGISTEEIIAQLKSWING